MTVDSEDDWGYDHFVLFLAYFVVGFLGGLALGLALTGNLM